jgi:hypothetical protein
MSYNKYNAQIRTIYQKKGIILLKIIIHKNHIFNISHAPQPLR